MIYINEIKNLRIYNKKFLLPIDRLNKKKGQSVMLLTPNVESSIGLINHKLLLNRHHNAYYLERDVSFYINNKNILESYKDEEYVHETETKEVVNEGIIDKTMANKVLIYDGYSEDVTEVRKYINIAKLDHYIDTFKIRDIKYPISISVYRDPDKIPTVKRRGINLIHYKYFNNSRDYEIYCNEVILEALIYTINPNCNPSIVSAVSSVYSGSYEEDEDGPTGTFGIMTIAESIKRLSLQHNGNSIIVSIIRTNNIDKLIPRNIIGSKKADLIETLTEDAMDPIAKLKRNITFSSRKGSAHLINKINRDIEDSIGVEEPVDIPIPTVSTSGTSDSEEDEEEITVDIEEYTIIDPLYGDYEVNESSIRTRQNITFFNNRSSSAQLKRILYKQRLRNNRQILPMYDMIKRSSPRINKTFLSLNRYKKFNLFIDLSYYNKLFFENNMYKLDRGVNLYFDLLSKFINDNRISEAGYENKVIFIPIQDWDTNPKTKMWMYARDINPISVLYRLMNKNLEALKKVFGDMDLVFTTEDNYFKINFSEFEKTNMTRFLHLFKSLRSNDRISINKEIIEDDNKDSNDAIVDTIIDDIENSQEIKISHLTGEKKKVGAIPGTSIKSPEVKIKVDTVPIAKDASKPSNKINDVAQASRVEGNKKEIIDKIEQAASISNNKEDTLEILDKDEEFKKILVALSSEEVNSNIVNTARAARITKLEEEILSKDIEGIEISGVKGTNIGDIIKKKRNYNDMPLEKTALPIDSINPEWKELTYINTAKQYDPNADIVAILLSLSTKSYPVSIRDIAIDDVSNSEDYILTYTVKMESHSGKRFTLKFDIPKLENDQYMLLRGNRKNIASQSFLIPIIKTDEDTVQIVSNYNKIFISRFGTTTGKSNKVADKIIKTLNKGMKTFKDIKVTTGDNSRVCSGYDLPIDYIDMASVFSKIETPLYTLYFNQIELRETYKDIIDFNKGLPIGSINSIKTVNGKFTKDPILYYNEKSNSNVTTFSEWLYDMLSPISEFSDIYKVMKESIRHTYSKASILNTDIPVVVLASYSEGLITVMEKAGVQYNISEKRPVKTNDTDVIRFSDGYLSYRITYSSSLLMNGLKECATEIISISDINKKSTYLDFLETFGGRIKADGIDNFYDMMIDPITVDVLKYCNLPTDYVELLMHANLLLSDNAYVNHGDMSGRRIRRNEIIAGYTYKVLSLVYGQYVTQLKRGRDATMSMKQSAIIDAILADPTAGDLSILNALGEKEAYDTTSTKGLSGMNSDRSYSLDKRSYDPSMLNVLSMSTGAADTVGIARQTTLNANVATVRGYVKPSSEEEMNSINSLCMTEALTPFGTTRDDPFRVAMNFTQTSKHSMRTKKSDALLITNGADEALPYMISDIFAFKAKQNGTIVEITDDAMIIEYNDKTHDYINLAEKVEKNSSSGFFVTLKLDTDLKVGNKVKTNQIVAYDKSSFDGSIGPNDNIAYRVGTLVKCALIDTDEGFEDSAIISNELSEAMTSDIVVSKQINITKGTNVYNLINIGQKIEDGDALMVMQSSFDEEDANMLLKNLAAEEEDISDLGRIKITSKVTGVVQDIIIYRTVEIEEMSESLQKLCKKYESKVRVRKNVMRKYNINKEEELPADYKLDPIGKLKGAADGVSIVFYLKYEDKMSVGDKLIYWSAQKGVIKYIIPEGDEPSTLSRPDEKIHTLISVSAANGRMVTSIPSVGVINRLLIEASRKAKDMAGIKYDVNIL